MAYITLCDSRLPSARFFPSFSLSSVPRHHNISFRPCLRELSSIITKTAQLTVPPIISNESQVADGDDNRACWKAQVLCSVRRQTHSGGAFNKIYFLMAFQTALSSLICFVALPIVLISQPLKGPSGRLPLKKGIGLERKHKLSLPGLMNVLVRSPSFLSFYIDVFFGEASSIISPNWTQHSTRMHVELAYEPTQ